MTRKRNTRRKVPKTPISCIATTGTRSKKKANGATLIAASVSTPVVAFPTLSPFVRKRASAAVLSTVSKKSKLDSPLITILDDESDSDEVEYLYDEDDFVELQEENAACVRNVNEVKAYHNCSEQQPQKKIKPLQPDLHLPRAYANRVRIIDHKDELCNVILTHVTFQACAQQRRSEFVVLQALATTDTDDIEFMVWHRSGQVGSVGVGTMEGPWTRQQDAISHFCSVFESKANCKWSRRNLTLQPRTESFTWIEVDQSIVKSTLNTLESVDVHQDAMPRPIRRPPSMLHSDVQAFLLAISNAASSNQYYSRNTSKTLDVGSLDATIVSVPLPLGHLSRSTIERGFNILDSLYGELLMNKDLTNLVSLSDKFYSIIPHPPDQLHVINTMVKLGTKVELLHAYTTLLWRQEETFTFCKYQKSLVKNYLDECYHALGCRLFPLESSSREFGLVQSYIFNSSCCVGGDHGKNIELFQLFRVEKLSEAERYAPFRSYANRRILWHGSRMCNWLGILTHGLLISPPNVPHNGSSFGLGIYFTDKISKAMGYSYPTFSDDKYSQHQVFLLSEVALGDKKNVYKGHSGARRSMSKNSFHTCHGVGRCVPDAAGDYEDATGAIWPLGKAKKIGKEHATLQHSEYVIYNVEQARMRYLVVTNGGY